MLDEMPKAVAMPNSSGSGSERLREGMTALSTATPCGSRLVPSICGHSDVRHPGAAVRHIEGVFQAMWRRGFSPALGGTWRRVFRPDDSRQVRYNGWSEDPP